MPNYTQNLNMKLPLTTEQYNIADFNGNSNILDSFAGTTNGEIIAIKAAIEAIKPEAIKSRQSGNIFINTPFVTSTTSFQAPISKVDINKSFITITNITAFASITTSETSIPLTVPLTGVGGFYSETSIRITSTTPVSGTMINVYGNIFWEVIEFH